MSTEKHRRIYSRRGDLGETSLSFGPRVGKDQKRIVVVGTIDELSSWLGLVRTECPYPEINELLLAIQQKLLIAGAQVSTLDPVKCRIVTITPEDVAFLEQMIDSLEESLSPLDHFIIPGSTRCEAILHLARAVCRRAERRVVALLRHDETLDRTLVAWFNRLGDLLFVAARYTLAHQKQDT